LGSDPGKAREEGLMARALPAWVGKTDDTAIPPRVRVRVFERCEGKCGQCGRKIRPGEGWTLEHLIALINGGANAEHNLGVTCDWCLPQKNAADVAEKAVTARVRSKHLGIRPPSKLRSAPFPKRQTKYSAARGAMRNIEDQSQ
jgi:5-methylcytosine-specific restriction protein A